MEISRVPRAQKLSPIFFAHILLQTQGRHNFSKTEGRNIKNDTTFNVFGLKFQGKWVKFSKKTGGRPPPTPLLL